MKPSPSSSAANTAAGLGILEDPDRMRVVLQEHLLSGTGQSPRITECRITNLRRRDGSRGTVQYDILIEDETTGETRGQTITGLIYGGERTRRVWDVIRAAQHSHSAELAGAMPRRFAYVPELDMLLQVFPHDHRLPALALMMTTPPPHIVQPLLQVQEFGPGSWQMQGWDATTIQYRADMRAIVQVDLTAVDSDSERRITQRFYAKVYRDGEHAEQALRAQRDIYDATLQAGTNLVVAKPAHYFADLHTLVTATLPGTSLSKIIRRGDGAEAAVRSAARAVTELHRLDVSAPKRPVAEEIAQLKTAQATLAAARPDLANLISGIVGTVAAGLGGAPVTLIHGDLKPDHLLVHGERVGLIDFDLAAIADPMTDVAHLVAFLAVPQARARQRNVDADLAARVFIDEYFRHAPAAWRPRLRLHHAITSVHKAAGMSRRRGAGQGQQIEDVLREGQAILAGSGDEEASPSFKRRLTKTTAR